MPRSLPAEPPRSPGLLRDRPAAPESPAAERLIATLADVAIDQLLESPPRPVQSAARPEEPPDLPEVRLSPEERAALSDDGLMEDPPPGLWPQEGHDTLAADDSDLNTDMPTDAELEALLSEPLEEPEAHPRPAPRKPAPRPAPATRRSVETAFTDAAAELAAELDEEAATPMRSRPLEPTLRGRAVEWEDEFEDEIEADAAVESRGSVNLSEPPAEDVLLQGEPEVDTELVAEAVGPVSWWMRPLIWLNSPLAGAPQTWRQTAGKVAILTLLNATAVLVYLFVIRR